jgi:hypothetical protein
MSLSIPFYRGGSFFGGSISSTRPIPYTVQLDGMDLPIETAEYRHNGIKTLRDGVVTSDQPDDSQYNSEGAWWRYQVGWQRGAGLDVQDFGERADPLRFRSSKGVDPWQDNELCLLPATAKVRDNAAVTPKLFATGNHVYAAFGTTMDRSADMSSWAAITGLTGTINDISTDGTDVYVATTTHIYRITPASVAATALTVDTANYNSVAFVSNRLLAGSANILYEIASGGTRDAIYTHFQAAFRWTTIFAVGSRIYVGGYAGNRTELYALTADENGDLIRTADAAPFAFNELLNKAISYAGSVLLLTNLGLRFATLSGDGSITFGPLISAPGNVVDASAEGRFVWFTWQNFPDGGCGVGRLALDLDVGQLQPAYASDVYTADANAAATGVCRYLGRTVFAVPNQGIYATSPTDKVTEGWVESGEIYFGTVEEKAITNALVVTSPIGAGQSVSATITDHTGATLGSGTVTETNARGVEISLDGQTADWVRVRIDLASSGGTAMCVYRWRLRGFPVVPAVDEWIVPLIVHRHVVVNDSTGQILSLDQLAVCERLKDRWRSKKVIAYREGKRTYRVRIDNFEQSVREWDDSSDFFDVVFRVRLISV